MEEGNNGEKGREKPGRSSSLLLEGMTSVFETNSLFLCSSVLIQGMTFRPQFLTFEEVSSVPNTDEERERGCGWMRNM